MTDSPRSNQDLSTDLAKSEEVFRLLVQNVVDYAIFMLDPDGMVVTWNEGAQRIKGYNEDEAIGKHFSFLYTQEAIDLNHPQRELEVARTEGRYEEEGWRVRKDGSRIWANIVITSILDGDRLIGFAKVTRDLTERKLASHNEQIFKLLVDSVGDYAIFMLDPDGNVMTWNEGAQRIKGYTASEIVGKHFSIFYTAQSNEKRHPEWELEVARRDGRYEEEGWRVRKDGSRIWANVVITAVYNHGQLVGFAKVTRDLTERKMSQQREEIFSLLVSSVRDYAIFMISPDGDVMTWNEGAQRINGYTAEDVIGKHFSLFYTRESQKRKHPHKELEIARAEGRYEEEGWRVRKDGSLIWANVVITAVYDNGKLLGFAKVTRDLTQRLLADQEREMSAKVLDETNTNLQRALDIKSRFLSTISHEVRTPMGAIIGMTEILTTEDLGEDNNVLIRGVFDASKRLLQLLNNLLEAARMDAGELSLENRNFPIRAVIGDVRQLVRTEADRKLLRITGTLDSQIPEYVYGDELKLRQVLLNLAHNAIKFTEAGIIDISAEVIFKTEDTLNIRFIVADTGIGIKHSDREKLFQPFVQAEDSTKRVYGGAGLGLSISKQLIDLMDGTIGIESEIGKGSKFWFDIPFKSEAV